ncbi:transferase hexapeptide (six repeat-containing protein) [Blastococcus aurantiacus]|uniref:Transferase hexapeptide (Six repeat-containing protein) n=1 Tax=Blastococcus aurantiacus TaxID=1550231 RepID=A0A1G7PTL1_9ACTN|nr:acyltransferase [Blastococcus aurantiacus]SDF88730.1 transferase hexapeptide (six repeat-containing protein) [Blastococcus aurantiacus]
MSVTSVRSQIEERPGNNRIVGQSDLSARLTVTFEKRAENCVLELAEGVAYTGTVRFRAPNSTIRIGARTAVTGHIGLGRDCTVTIGEGGWIGRGFEITAAEGQQVVIGDDCLIAPLTNIRADDSHPLYDGLTGRRINPSRSVHIGDHVWIGRDSVVLPGSRIGNGAVIGFRGMVTSSRPVPDRALAVGSPVQVVRRNILWSRKHLQRSEIPESMDPDPAALAEAEAEAVVVEAPPGLLRRFLRR